MIAGFYTFCSHTEFSISKGSERKDYTLTSSWSKSKIHFDSISTGRKFDNCNYCCSRSKNTIYFTSLS